MHLIIALKMRQIAKAIEQLALADGISVRHAHSLFEAASIESSDPNMVIVTDCLFNAEIAAKELLTLKAEAKHLSAAPVILLIGSADPAFITPLLPIDNLHLVLATDPSILVFRRAKALLLDGCGSRNPNIFRQSIDSCRTSMLILEAADDVPQIAHTNEAFVRMSGYPREDAMGESLNLLVGENQAQSGFATILETTRRGLGCAVDLVCVRKGGSSFYCHIQISPIRTESGKPSHFIALLSEASAKKQVNPVVRENSSLRQPA